MLRPRGEKLQRGRRSSRRIGRGEGCSGVSVVRFNEAAVHHGGSGPAHKLQQPLGHASTRPPFITADRLLVSKEGSSVELLQRGRRSSRRIGARSWPKKNSGCCGFNEAAVHHGGSVRCARRYPPRWCSFNEAAVHHGGSESYSLDLPPITLGFNEAAVHHGGSVD